MSGRTLRIVVVAWLLANLGCGDAQTTSSVKALKTSDPEKPRQPEKPGEPEKTPPRPEPVPTSEFDQALARAKLEGKLVFVEFSAVWCGPCQQMKRDTFTNSQVQARLAGYVTLFVDSDRDPLLTRRFRVGGIPAYFLLRPDLTLAKSGSGYLGAREFLQWLDGVA